MDNKVVRLSELKTKLREKISKYNNDSKSEKFVRIELRTEVIDPLLWLKVQPYSEKVYFESRGRGEPVFAAVGSTFRVKPDKNDTLQTYFKKLGSNLSDGQKFYGGVSFYKSVPDTKEWESFGPFNFILPRFEYILREKKAFFAINLEESELQETKMATINRDIENINMEIPEKHEKSGISELVEFRPDKKSWVSGVSGYLDKISSGDLRKIVPARRLELKNSGKADPFGVMHELKKSGDYTANFLFTFNGKEFFAGSTPERLFHRDGELLTTESVAGTISRGKGSDEDKLNGENLKNSKKETLEHDFVTNDIVNKIDPVCELVAISARALLKLSNLQHLYRRISGKLKKSISDGEILDRIFPTPAVSGVPVERCLKILDKHEQFHRGWYAGAVGFAGKDVSDYYVGIRSVLMNEEKIYIYSGAGIVEGSDPEKEWEEIDLKIRKYKKIFKYET